jgi:hypothetical protein
MKGLANQMKLHADRCAAGEKIMAATYPGID